MALNSLTLAGESYLFDFLGTALDGETYKLLTLSTAIEDKNTSKFAADVDGLFTWDVDGKILSFTVIPEPAEVAALLGLIALGFVIRRRFVR